MPANLNFPGKALRVMVPIFLSCLGFSLATGGESRPANLVPAELIFAPNAVEVLADKIAYASSFAENLELPISGVPKASHSSQISFNYRETFDSSTPNGVEKAWDRLSRHVEMECPHIVKIIKGRCRMEKLDVRAKSENKKGQQPAGLIVIEVKYEVTTYQFQE
ncbi:MAG: hypothetical protein GY742_13670 [Hyphomicrobiales bacterium]|nr:hypothetical protein [Hyphomicrobiales bacterium]